MLRVFQMVTLVIAVLAVVFLIVGLAVPGWLVYVVEYDKDLLDNFNKDNLNNTTMQNSESPQIPNEIKISASFSLWNVRMCETIQYYGSEYCLTKSFGDLGGDKTKPHEGKGWINLVFLYNIEWVKPNDQGHV